MPDNIRALIAILILTTTVFLFARESACTIIDKADFTRRRNLWFALTVTAFLAPDFWVYTIIAIPLLVYVKKLDSNPTALFVFILFALPPATIEIPGMGVINFLFDLSHARLLSLIILLPIFLTLNRQSDTIAFGRTGPDKALFAYLLLSALLELRSTTATDMLRQTFYLFTDVFLPYFVISRSLKNMQDFREVILSYVLPLLILSLVTFFEFYRHWLLYRDLPHSLGLLGSTSKGAYLERDGMVRAAALTGSALAMGYLAAVGIGFYLFLQRSIQKSLIRWLGLLLLIGGIIGPLSRGPWVGFSMLLLVFFSTGRNAITRLMALISITILTFSLISVLPGGETVINLLPYIGNTEKSTIDAREVLITSSMKLIEKYPWLGSINIRQAPEMQPLVELGGGIVDITNTYLEIALAKGLIGLGLFVSFFALTLMGTYRALRTIADKNSEEYLLGQVLLGILTAILVTIATVSSISFIPIVYWSVAGMAVAYVQMIRNQSKRSFYENADAMSRTAIASQN
jgi:O-antigen ligase